MDDLFGGMFDFNGDGATDPIEAGLGSMILDEILSDEDTDADEDPE